MDELKQKWDLILSTLKEDYDIQDISFKTWIKPIQLYSLEGNTITLIISEESMGIAYIEKKYLKPLQITICEIMGQEYEVRLIGFRISVPFDHGDPIKQVSGIYHQGHQSSRKYCCTA